MKRKAADSRTSSPAVPPRARTARLVVRQLPEETLVYDLDRSRAHCLGTTAASVWRHCDGRKGAERIAAGVRKDTGVDVGEAGVWVAVDRLAAAKLLDEPLPQQGTLAPRVAEAGGHDRRPHRRLHHRAALRRSRDLRRQLHEPSQHAGRELRGDPLLSPGDGKLLPRRAAVSSAPAGPSGGCSA